MSLSALSKQHAQKWSSLYALNVDASAFTLICDKLQALQHVQIEFYPQLSTCSAENIFSQLAQLKNVQQLKLLFYYGLTTSNTNPLSCITEANIGQMARLDSVRLVELSAVISVHQLTLLERLFCKAQRVTLAIRQMYINYFEAKLCDQCHNCGYAQRAIAKLKANPAKSCINSLLFDCKQGTIVSCREGI